VHEQAPSAPDPDPDTPEPDSDTPDRHAVPSAEGAEKQ
jgi:hypothetical protein